MALMKTTRNNKVKMRMGTKFLFRYLRLVLWLFDIKAHSPQYQVLIKRIYSLLSSNGNEFTTRYLKECVRLIQHWIAGVPSVCNEADLRVATRRGLPLIIPGLLRLRMEARDLAIIRIILTLLSVFRIIKYPGTLKLETITGPFTGISPRLPAIEVALIWKRFTPFLPQIPLSKLAVDRPLLLKTAGPNFKVSILGAPLDALA